MGLPKGLVVVAWALCTAPGFEPHRLQLHADHALSTSLLGLLLRGLDTAAVNLSLLHDRQPTGGLEWGWVTGIASTLASPTLQPALESHTAAADDGSLLSTLDSAATVLQRLPAPANTQELCAHFNMVSLVAWIADQA